MIPLILDVLLLNRTIENHPPPRAAHIDAVCDGCTIARGIFATFRPLWVRHTPTYVPVLLCAWCLGDPAQEERALRHVEKRGYARSSVET